MNKAPNNFLLMVFGTVCWLLPALFIGLRLITPSDGARLSRNNLVFSAEGALLSPYGGTTTPIQEGDLLVAVNGVSILSRARTMFSPFFSPAHFQPGESLNYTISRDGKQQVLQIKLMALPWKSILAEHWGVLLLFMITQLIVIFVYLKRREDPTAQAFFIWGMSGSHAYTWAVFLQASDLLDGTGFWLFHLAASGLWLVFWAATLHMTLVLPKKLIVPKRPGLWLSLLYLSPFLVFSAYLLYTWFNTQNILTWWAAWATAQTLVAAIFSLLTIPAIISQVFTNRSEVDRIKARWVITGTMLSLIPGLGLYFLPGLFIERPFISPNVLGIINFPFIIATAIAIWRYKLFDIDLIIRRTLVYGALTAILSLIYFASVLLLQGLFGRLTGVENSPAVIVVSTLLVAALVTPLRRGIQNNIDRRFYRRKYDAEKALAQFAAEARNETELEALTSRLVGVVNETLQPEQASLWLKRPVEDTK